MKMARTETDKAEREEESLREREKRKKGEEGDTARDSKLGHSETKRPIGTNFNLTDPGFAENSERTLFHSRTVIPPVMEW